MKTTVVVSTLTNFHVPLPEDVYAALREEASALKRPAKIIARKAIAAWLQERRRASVRQSIVAYATKRAGTTADLDPALEAASLELWPPKRKRRR